MPTTFVKGDLFNTDGIRAYAHGCNCAGAMDAGVAAQFKKRWPRMFDEYAARCADGRFHLGDVFVWNEDDVTVYNLAIQEHWKAKARLPALKKALLHAVGLAAAAGIERIGVPRIGAGLGGLDWSRVRSVLEQAGGAAGAAVVPGATGVTTVTLVVFEQFVRAGKA
jgi:O-acetyl-ADP-ribose deacetylase (regulator of RNase III)